MCPLAIAAASKAAGAAYNAQIVFRDPAASRAWQP
jgi:hypothetical protein